MDEDRLSPGLGRLIDAAKAAAAVGADGHTRGEGWAFLGPGGKVHAASDAAMALAAARATAGTVEEPVWLVSDLVAAAFAVAGESGETLLPRGDWRFALQDVDPDLPVAVKYLGRWVVVTLGEIPPE
jgi:hypothetical protein